jgi:hypothetical protein
MMQIFVLIVNIEDKIVPNDIDIQYWCIDGKYRIYVARHEMVGKIR